MSEVEALRRELEGRRQIGDLVSHSPLMQKIFEVLPAISASPSTVLICGETGTGKEVMARTTHSLSHHHKGPFVAVSCGALSVGTTIPSPLGSSRNTSSEWSLSPSAA